MVVSDENICKKCWPYRVKVSGKCGILSVGRTGFFQE